MTEAERVDELLFERATQGLSITKRRQLDTLIASSPQLDHDEFDFAAAAFDLALSGPEPALPDALKLRLRQLGRQFQGAGDSSREPLRLVDDPEAPAPAEVLPPPRSRTAAPGYGWWAAAAALLLALAGWWPRLAGSEAVGGGTEQAESVATAPADAGAIRWAWQPTESDEARGAAGAVVWSERNQTGFMEIRGLAPNDPRVAQYQLWIFDRTRDERYPVDGGVFDIPAGAAEVLIPIEAKIEVGEPYLFAVTVEKPGGVVVSDRERIVLLAQA